MANDQGMLTSAQRRKAKRPAAAKPVLLCLPTTKIVNGVTSTMVNAVTQLLCFAVTPTPLKNPIYDQNQFGTGNVHALKTKLLCLPSTNRVTH